VVVAFFSTVFVWWSGTIVLLAVTRELNPTKTNYLMFLAVLCLVLGFFGIYFFGNRPSSDAIGAYGSFLSAICIWIWLESSFLTGWITGSRKSPCPKNLGGFKRLLYAFQAVVHHEIHICLLAFGIFIISWDSSNKIGLYAFLILWVMRTSSKINIFLGVRNLYTNFLPKDVLYLASYFRKSSCNPIFPFLLALAITANLLFWNNALASYQQEGELGNILLATLLTLGVLEHFLMVVPFNCNKIWQFGLSPK
jgi:putative photosynthetic complex assembly protein 2